MHWLMTIYLVSIRQGKLTCSVVGNIFPSMVAFWITFKADGDKAIRPSWDCGDVRNTSIGFFIRFDSV